MKSEIIKRIGKNHIVDLVNVNDKDPLTGLLNRSQFEKELKFIMETIDNDGSEHAFCYIDLDSFKVINDVFGHETGDTLICSITEIIKSSLRQKDITARLGGDEFGLIIKHCDLDTAKQIAYSINESIRLFRNEMGSDYYGISASIGIAMINSETKNISELMKQADVACFTAKRAGGDRVQVYQDNDRQITLQHDDMKWFGKINKALDKDQFCLYLQTIASLGTNEFDKTKPACEVLVRMKDEAGNIIFPDEFLPTAIRYNLAYRLDSWVVKSTINHLNKSHGLLSQCSLVTINLTGQSIGDDRFLDKLIVLLQTALFQTSLLCFEITETAAIENIPGAVHFINTIKNKFNCQFALDDFGSGFASYKYIKELPVDIVKIDGEYVKDMFKDPMCKIVIKSLVDIAQACNKKTIAEWIEDEQMLNELQAIGVNYGQGYYLGKAMPIDEFWINPDFCCTESPDETLSFITSVMGSANQRYTEKASHLPEQISRHFQPSQNSLMSAA